MHWARRRFLRTLSFSLGAGICRCPLTGRTLADDTAVVESTMLDVSGLDSPMIVDSVELIRCDNEYLVRVRTRDGGEGIAAANSSRMALAYPILINQVAPFFVGRDARTLEQSIDLVFRGGGRYKLQGLLFWVAVAAVELAILDLLGRAANRSVAELFGDRRREQIAVYRASSNRGNSAIAEIEHLRALAESIDANALKFRLGGRMSRNVEIPVGRSEELIRIAREAFGPAMTLYADANSSYDVENAVRIGRLMEEHDYAFFEEPVPFDDLWGTRKVNRRLTIPVAGGEQEFSLRRMRWAIENEVMDVVQPDLHYFGGMVRCATVARWANRLGKPCTVHMSGSGLGWLYVLHFASFVEDPGEYQEYKGESSIPFDCPTVRLQCRRGKIPVPKGPGWGIEIDPDYLRRGERVS